MSVTLRISKVQLAQVPCSAQLEAIGPTGEPALTLWVELRRGSGALAGDWQYKVSGECAGHLWRAGWAKLRYVDKPGTMDARSALTHAAALAVYFASHDFALIHRENAAANPQEYALEPCDHAPTLQFAVAAANATAPWLRWDLGEPVNRRREQVCADLPPAPGAGKKFWPPFSVLPEVRQEIRLALKGVPGH